MTSNKTSKVKVFNAVKSFLPSKIVNSDEKKDHEILKGIIFCADISGFTAMSEKLSAIGREGAEEITKIINSFFDPLVEIIIGNNGSIFYFGGDAISAYFDEEISGDSALIAAKKCADFVKRSGVVKTSKGNFNIKIHIALTSGKFFYKDSGEEYILSGNSCFRVIKMLDHAAPQEIIIDSTLQKKYKNIKTKMIKQGLYRLESISVKKDHSKEKETEKALKIDYDKEIKRLNKYLPDWLQRRIELKQTFDQKDGEHRKAAVSFLHFKGIPFDTDPEKASKLMDSLINALERNTEPYNGWLDKIDFYKEGIRALVIFGFPKTLENDEKLAVLFARDMLNEKELKDIDIQIGINAGLIFGTPVGSDIRREYTVMGDTVNTAARIAAKAENRKITVGKRIIEKTENIFEFKALIAQKFKGKEIKIVNYEFVKERDVKAEKTDISKWLSESKKLVGHKTEISYLKRSITQVKKGTGKIIALYGEAGLGKSRIVREFNDIIQKSEFNVFVGNCLSYGKSLSYYPWVEIFNKYYNLLPNESVEDKKKKIVKGTLKVDKNLEEWIPVIGEVLGVEFPVSDIIKNLDNKIKKQKFFDIAFTIFKHITKTKPLCLVIEDLHWIDSISLELLNYIARNIKDKKILLLFAFRPIKDQIEFMEKEYYKVFQLKELSKEETVELVENLLSIDKMPDNFKNLIIKKSQGNPFYVEEIVKSLIEQGFIKEDKKKGWMFVGDIKDVSLPDSVEGVILSRIDRLDLVEREVIQLASVIGREFDEFIISGIYPDFKILKRSMQNLKKLDLIKIQDDDEKQVKYFFKHILTCEVSYNTLSFAKKREIHQKIGKFIEKNLKEKIDEYLGILSHHYFQAKDFEKSLVFSVKAGEKAKNVYANEEAIEFFTRAIDSYERLEELESKK